MSQEKKRLKNLGIGQKLTTLVFLLWTLVQLFPLYWMLTFSLKDNAEIFGDNVIGLPREWIWANYFKALLVGNMGRYFLNSFIVTAGTIVITCMCALMASYLMMKLFHIIILIELH